jgi:hypothetical protein
MGEDVDEVQHDAVDENGAEVAKAAGAGSGGTRLARSRGDDEMSDDEGYAQAMPTFTFDNGETYRQPDALGALMEAKFGERLCMSSPICFLFLLFLQQ